jgi:hypothetical protein
MQHGPIPAPFWNAYVNDCERKVQADIDQNVGPLTLSKDSTLDLGAQFEAETNRTPVAAPSEFTNALSQSEENTWVDRVFQKAREGIVKGFDRYTEAQLKYDETELEANKQIADTAINVAKAAGEEIAAGYKRYEDAELRNDENQLAADQKIADRVLKTPGAVFNGINRGMERYGEAQVQAAESKVAFGQEVAAFLTSEESIRFIKAYGKVGIRITITSLGLVAIGSISAPAALVVGAVGVVGTGVTIFLEAAELKKIIQEKDSLSGGLETYLEDKLQKLKNPETSAELLAALTIGRYDFSRSLSLARSGKPWFDHMSSKMPDKRYINTELIKLEKTYPGGSAIFEICKKPGVLGVNMTQFSSKNKTVLGVPRDMSGFWRELITRPEVLKALSPENLVKIKKGKAPLVDAQWISVFQQYATFIGQRFDHHHIFFGYEAIPLPVGFHSKFRKLAHLSAEGLQIAFELIKNGIRID